VRIHGAGVNPYDTYMRAGTYALKPSLPTLLDQMAPESLKRLARASKKLSETIAYTRRGPSPVHMRNMHSRSKSKCIRFRRKLISNKVQEFGFPTELRIMRCITRPKRTLPRPYLCTAQVAVWASRRSKSRTRHGSEGFWHCRDAKGLEIATQEGAHQVFDHRKTG